MGVYVSVRGWIECNREQWPLVTAEILSFHQKTLSHLANSWSLPNTGGGYSRFVFFGCTIRESEVEDLKSLFVHLASTSTRDGECIDHLDGLFTISHELCEEHAGMFWILESGRFTECEEALASQFDERSKNSTK